MPVPADEELRRQLLLRFADRAERISEEEATAERRIRAAAASKGTFQSGQRLRQEYRLWLETTEKKAAALIAAAEELICIGYLEASDNSRDRVAPFLTEVVEGCRLNVERSVGKFNITGVRAAFAKLVATDFEKLSRQSKRRLEIMFFNKQKEGKNRGSENVQIGTVHVSGGVFNLQGTIGSIAQHATRIEASHPELAEAVRAFTAAAEHLAPEKRPGG